MPNALPAETRQDDFLPERDVVAMIAMLDYLIAEITSIDPMSAQCLILARRSLLEAVADSLTEELAAALVKPN